MTHNLMKRTLAGVMAVLTVAAYMPANVGGFLTEGTAIVASAEGEQAIEFTDVKNADELIAAITAGKNAKLTDDITLSAGVTVNITSDVTVDFNNNLLTANDRAFWVKSGTLTLTGKGSVASMGDVDKDKSVIRVGDGSSEAANKVNANLYVDKDVTVTSDKCYGITVFGGATTERVDVYGTVSTTGENGAISGNGNSYNGGTAINIYPGAVVSSTYDVAIYHPQAGTLNITGGTITGAGGIEAKSGTVNISGDAAVTATGVEDHKINRNGTSTRGYAIAAVENNSYTGKPVFNIDGGTYTGLVGVVADDEVADAKKGSISVTGGNFDKALDAAYLADGYMQDEQGNVILKSDYNWVLNESKTYTLDEDMVCKNVVVPSGVNAVLDLNGHTITTNDTSVYVVGKLTIEDNTESKLGAIVSQTYNAIAVFSGADLTINSGNYFAQEVAVLFSSKVYGANATINGGTFTTKDNFVLGFNGTKRDAGTEDLVNTLTVNGGTFNGNITTNGYVACGIYCPQNDVVNVKGGTFNINGGAGIVARAGKVTVEDGTFNCSGAVTGKVGDSRVVVPCSPIVFDTDAKYPGLTADANIAVMGGTFISDSASVATVSDTSRVTVSGGQFTSVPAADYIADGYYVDQEGTVTSKTDISSFATISLNKYKFSYSGSMKYVEPTVEAIDGSYELIENEDYVIEGDTVAEDVGTYIVKIRGIGKYSGEIVKNWSITQSCYVSVSDSEYGGLVNGNGYYTYGQSATVTAQPTYGDKVFSYWKIGNTMVSTSPSYSFIVKSGVEVVAVYEEEKVEQKAVLNLTTFQTSYNGKNAVGFDFTHSVPEGFTVKEVGLRYGTNKLCGANTSVSGYAKKNLRTEGASVGVSDLLNNLKTRSTVKKYVASYKKNNGTVRFSYALGNTNDDAYANAIGYVTYVNDKNETVTVYSEPVAACYNSANSN